MTTATILVLIFMASTVSGVLGFGLNRFLDGLKLRRNRHARDMSRIGALESEVRELNKIRPPLPKIPTMIPQTVVLKNEKD